MKKFVTIILIFSFLSIFVAEARAQNTSSNNCEQIRHTDGQGVPLEYVVEIDENFCETPDKLDEDVARSSCVIEASNARADKVFCREKDYNYCCSVNMLDADEPDDPDDPDDPDNPDDPDSSPLVSCPDNIGEQDKMNSVLARGESLDVYLIQNECQKVNDGGEQYLDCRYRGAPILCFTEDRPVNPKDSFKEDACDELEGEERSNCEKCIFTADKSELTGAIWTELGCIDPSPAGLITRIFQIGLGIMSGIGVLRFGQIALLYQSKDQEKIKEAGGMMVSLMGGLVMLIAGIILLEFLGINILGLPDDFLG